MSESKTARASAVKAPAVDKKIIPDEEMIRILRLNTEQNVYTGNTDFVKALFRAHDNLLETLDMVRMQFEELQQEIAERDEAALDSAVERDLSS